MDFNSGYRAVMYTAQWELSIIVVLLFSTARMETILQNPTYQTL
jgi:hypothetical protein